MIYNKYVVEKYKDRPLAVVNNKSGRTIGVSTFISEAQFPELTEELETGEILLTLDGLEFIKEYYGFEGFLTLVSQVEGNEFSSKRLSSGIKWILQRTKSEHGINLSEAKRFELPEKDKEHLNKKFSKNLLAKGDPPFTKRFPEKYYVDDFLDPVTFMFFLDKLDSSEAILTEAGLEFIKEGYGWDRLVKIFDYLHENGFILRHKTPEDIVLWIKNLGQFSEDRSEMLSRDGF